MRELGKSLYMNHRRATEPRTAGVRATLLRHQPGARIEVDKPIAGEGFALPEKKQKIIATKLHLR